MKTALPFITKLFFVPLLLIFNSRVAAQVVIATGLPNSASSGAGTSMAVSFCIQNSNPTPVTLTGLDNYMNSTNGNTTWTLRYSATSLSGTANMSLWTAIATTAGPVVTSTGIYPLFSGLSFQIPGNTTYRFAVQTSSGSMVYGGSATTPNSFTSSGISLQRGDYQIASANVGYAGNATAPGFNPRFFCGTIYLNAGPPCTGTPTAPVITTAALTAPVCANGTKALSATNAGAPAGIGYQWEQSANAGGPFVSVSGGTGANSLNYTTAALTAKTYYRVKSICGNNSAVSAVYEVLVGPQPSGAITGPSQVCPGQSYTFSVTPAFGATSYTWTKPSGWTGTSTTNTATFTSNGTVGSVTVVPNGACGASPTQTKTLTGNTPPGAPGIIAGPTVFCNGSIQQYSIPALANTVSYQWTLPAGWTFSGSSTGNTVNVISNSTPGSISVQGVNGCGNGPQASKVVTFSANAPVVPTASISTASASVCSGVPVVFNANVINGGTSPGYQWKRNGNVVASTPVYTSSGLANGDVITLAVLSSATCASPAAVNSSNSITLNVTPSVTPGINVNADEPSNQVCAGSPVVFTASTTGAGSTPAYQWYRNNLPVGSNAPTYTVSNLTSADSIYCRLTSSAACPIGGVVRNSNRIGMDVVETLIPAVSISHTPVGLIQPNTPVTFTAAPVNGGAAPQYQWLKNGLVIYGATGAVYTTAGLRNGEEISVRMVSTAACANPTFASSNRIGAQIATGIAATDLSAGLELSPNPSSGSIHVKGPWEKIAAGGSLELEVVNAVGQTILRVIPQTPSANEVISVTLPQGTASGMYVLRVRSVSGTVAMRFEVQQQQ